MGVVFQKTVRDDKPTVRENLLTRAAFYGIGGMAWKQRLAELDGMLSLADILDCPFGKLSGANGGGWTSRVGSSTRPSCSFSTNRRRRA